MENSLLTQCRFLCCTHHLETVPGTTTLSGNQTLVNSSIGSHVLLYQASHCQHFHQKNSQRKRRAEILTSSPYKKSLEEAAAKKVKKTKPKATRTQAKRKPKSKQTLGNDRIEINVEACSDTDSWYCFMCEESYKEKMVFCRDCAKLVHVDCADTDDDLFVCEICSNNIS